MGIYEFTYKTGFFSGTYRLGDVVDALHELLGVDDVLKSKRIIFVCHSMGGIVARKFVVSRALLLVEKSTDIAFFLLASPSLGSDYARWLNPLARLFGHTQADALRFSQTNSWLLDLDSEFLTLKESGKLQIKGKELVEDTFLILRRFLRKQVVTPISGARYFGQPFKVPNSDHSSIAKVQNGKAIQHRILVKFVEEVLQYPNKSKTGSDRNPKEELAGEGVSIERHLEIVDQRIAEVKQHWVEISEAASKVSAAEAEALRTELERATEELSALRDLQQDPSAFVECSRVALVTAQELLYDETLDADHREIEIASEELTKGNYTAAERILERYMDSKLVGAEKSAMIFYGLGAIAEAKLQWERAETLYRRSFFAEPSLDRFIRLLEFLKNSGRHTNALNDFNTGRKALGFEEGSIDAIKLEVVKAMLLLNEDETEKCRRSLASVSEQLQQTSDPEVALQLALAEGHLASLEGDHGRAVKFYREANRLLDLDEIEAASAEHLRARILGNMASEYAESGKVSKAVSLTKQSLELLQGDDHSSRFHAAIRLNNLGDFLVRQGKISAGISKIEESIRLGVELLPADHPSFISRKVNLAIAYGDNNQPDKALNTLKSIKYDERELDLSKRRAAVKAEWMLSSELYRDGAIAESLGSLLRLERIGVKYLNDGDMAASVPLFIERLRGILIDGAIGLRKR